jgi:hypothetical protein
MGLARPARSSSRAKSPRNRARIAYRAQTGLFQHSRAPGNPGRATGARAPNPRVASWLVRELGQNLARRTARADRRRRCRSSGRAAKETPAARACKSTIAKTHAFASRQKTRSSCSSRAQGETVIKSGDFIVTLLFQVSATVDASSPGVSESCPAGTAALVGEREVLLAAERFVRALPTAPAVIRDGIRYEVRTTFVASIQPLARGLVLGAGGR